MITKDNPIIDRTMYSILGVILWLSMSFLPGWATVFVIVAGILLVTMKFNPEMLILLIVLSIPFEIKQDVIGGFTVFTTEAIIFISSIAWLRQLLSGRKLKLPDRRLTISIILFFITMLLSCLVARELSMSVKQLIRWAEVFIVYLFVFNFLREKRAIRFIIYSIVVTGSITAIIGLFQFFAGGLDFREVVSLFGCSDPYAGYLGLLVFLSLILYIYEKPGKKKLLLGAGFAIQFLTLVVAFSRGGWAGFVVAFIVFFVFSKQLIRKKLVYTGVVMMAVSVLIIAIMPPVYKQPGLSSISKTERLFSAFSNNSVKVRFAFWRAAVQSIRDHPILGVGVGNYQYVHKQYGIALFSNFYSWASTAIANIEDMKPNTTYRVSMDYRVAEGHTGEDDFLMLIQYTDNNERAFQTHLPNAVIIKDSKEWTHVEGKLITETSRDSLSNVELHWAHNQKAVMQFRNIEVLQETEEGELLPVQVDQSYFHLHNLYLQHLVETGIIGLLALLYMVIMHLLLISGYLLGLRKLVSSNPDENKEQYEYRFIIGLGCLCGMTAFLVHSFVDILFTHSIGVLFGIVMGIAIILKREG